MCMESVVFLKKSCAFIKDKITSLHLLHWLIFVRQNKRIICDFERNINIRVYAHIHNWKKRELSVKSTMTGKSHIKWTKQTKKNRNKKHTQTIGYITIHQFQYKTRKFIAFSIHFITSMCMRFFYSFIYSFGSEW